MGHYGTSRVVAVSISYEVIAFFNLPNPYSRTVALRSTQPLTETATKNLLEGKAWRAHNADLTPHL
jgi:hypothetical protein